MRYTPAFPELPLHLFLDPRRILRWVWLGRVVLVCAILVAAAFSWTRADPDDTLVATLAFAATVLATAMSAMYADIYRLPTGRRFYSVQCAIDLALVTAVVHITGGWSSQFAALYILVIAASALILPRPSGHVVAALSCLLYVGDVLWLRGEPAHFGIVVEALLFLVVGVGAEAIASRLRNDGRHREAIAASLAKVQLEAADILRTIRSGIVTVDADGRLLYANPAASDLLGVHLRSFTGRPILRTLRDIAPELADLLERSARDGKRTTRAEGVIRRDGVNVAIGVTTTTIDRDAPRGGQTATAIFQDISDSKRVQALHVRAERLEAVAELSASLAHEIRNPLASIRSATEQLARRHAQHGLQAPQAAPADQFSVDDDDERTLHDLVVREADRLDRLLGEFLDFARARVTSTSMVNVGAVVEAAARMARAHPACTPGIVIEDALHDDALVAPLFVRGDEDLLHRALFNLLLNAVQALAAHGGRGVVQVGVEPETHDDGRTFVRVAVTDDGPGVPYELRERLFEPFVTGRIGGSGLGLPVVHRAAEAHEGQVFVDHLDRGTRFTLLLPAADAHTMALATDATTAHDAASPADEREMLTLTGTGS